MSCNCIQRLCDLLSGLSGGGDDEDAPRVQDDAPQVQDEVEVPPLEEPPTGGRVVTGSMVGPSNRKLPRSPDIKAMWTPKKSRKDTKRKDNENDVINVDIPTPQQARRATGYATGNAAVGNTANKEVICVDTPTPQKKIRRASGSSTAPTSLEENHIRWSIQQSLLPPQQQAPSYGTASIATTSSAAAAGGERKQQSPPSSPERKQTSAEIAAKAAAAEAAAAEAKRSR